MDRGAWQSAVHRVTKSQTWLREYHSANSVTVHGGKVIYTGKISQVMHKDKVIDLTIWYSPCKTYLNTVSAVFFICNNRSWGYVPNMVLFSNGLTRHPQAEWLHWNSCIRDITKCCPHGNTHLFWMDMPALSLMLLSIPLSITLFMITVSHFSLRISFFC